MIDRPIDGGDVIYHPFNKNNLRLIAPTALTGLKPFAAGTYSIVYKGTYASMPVAIKAPHNAKKVHHLSTEYAALRALINAPNVVPCVGRTYIDGLFSLVFSYCSGGTLTKQILDSLSTPPPVLSRIHPLLAIAAALAYIHEQGVVHCDVKDDNVLIDGPAYYLADFGFAVNLNRDEKIPHRRGTPLWMSPERFNTETTASTAFDVYALALLMWELACWATIESAYPAEITNDLDAFTKHVLSSERPTIPDTVPPRLAQLIGRGWLHDPTKRPSAKEMHDEIGAIKREEQAPLILAGMAGGENQASGATKRAP